MMDRKAKIQVCDHKTRDYEGFKCIEDVTHDYDNREVFAGNVALYCNELHGDDKNFFLPDVMVVCDRKGIREDGVHVAPTFVAEVTSIESHSIDFIQKMQVYVDIGVHEYWVVDLQRERIVRFLSEGLFAPEEFLYSDTKKMIVESFPGLEIDLTGIFETGTN